ncbi:DNA-binding protein WhiA [Mycoplasma miroungirhinis]|uniref:Probable cell division protein WhiA n=1 Tax=Mycoplasma miroungirhinis TaxID=754516 RepID=A0A6M4JDT8_9MOLU|nr:DNA-binding protein WhiA [Mycoplasma miroungirhinis]QJR44408.1 DNA-binding protein WhiA [Mycoplasma miroungirhinis]
MKPTFTQKVKSEVISSKITFTSAINILNGILYTQTNTKIHKLIINNENIKQFIEKILQILNIEYKLPKKNWLLFQIPDVFFTYKYKKEKDFFIGIFIISGSVSDIQSTSYHLEIKTKNFKFANDIQEIMEQYGIFFKMVFRKDHYLLYIKKVEQICDFLKAIGAVESYLVFEEKKIDRDYINTINRLTNFDFYNQQKIAKSYVSFLKKYKWLSENSLQDDFTFEQIIFYEIKKDNPGASLNDLVLLLEQKNVKKTKSTLGYYLKKIDKVYNKYKK